MKHRNRSTTQPKRKLLTCALASVLVIASGHAIAQSSNATLRGKAEAGAQVTAVNTATGSKRQVTANADGSYALAEQLGNAPLQPGQQLQGELHSVGLETLQDSQTQATYEVFMQAYGLSAEGLRLALL